MTPARQSGTIPPVKGERGSDVERARARFADLVHRRLHEMGVEERNRVTWLADAINARGDKARWQTVQFWLDGKSFPHGYRLRLVAEALGMTADELVGPMTDDVDPPWPTWRAFLETPEGSGLSVGERWKLRLFTWDTPPTVGDYRQLLALIRSNAERR